MVLWGIKRYEAEKHYREPVEDREERTLRIRKMWRSIKTVMMVIKVKTKLLHLDMSNLISVTRCNYVDIKLISHCIHLFPALRVNVPPAAKSREIITYCYRNYPQ